MRRCVNAGLGRERALAHIWRVTVGRAVQDLVEHAARVRELAQPLGRDAGFEAIGELALQQQRRNDRRHVGVAAALAEPVERALDLAAAGAHRHRA